MKSKLIWFGLAAVVICVVSYYTYQSVPNLFISKSVQTEAKGTEATEQSSKEKDTSSQQLNAQDQAASTFISQYHHDLNNLTGWGAINHPNWDNVHSTAEQIVQDLDKMKYNGNVDLQKDFQDIHQMAQTLTTTESKEQLLKLHRFLHDLDVVMNHANGENKYYSLTKWGNAHKNVAF